VSHFRACWACLGLKPSQAELIGAPAFALITSYTSVPEYSIWNQVMAHTFAIVSPTSCRREPASVQRLPLSIPTANALQPLLNSRSWLFAQLLAEEPRHQQQSVATGVEKHGLAGIRNHRMDLRLHSSLRARTFAAQSYICVLHCVFGVPVFALISPKTRLRVHCLASALLCPISLRSTLFRDRARTRSMQGRVWNPA
jgi:hypothetical protein